MKEAFVSDEEKELNRYEKVNKPANTTRKKNTLQKYKDMGLTYDHLYEEYIIKNRSLQSLADEFDVKISFIRTVLSKYEIVKDPKIYREKAGEIARKQALNPNSNFRRKSTPEQSRIAQAAAVKSRRINQDRKLAEEGITYDSLYDFYITQNKSLKELMIILGRKKSSVRILLERFEIPAKSQEMRDELQKKNFDELYEDEEKVQELVKKTQSTIRKLYGNKWYRVTSSKPEKEIVEYIQSTFPELLIKQGDYSIIKNPETGAALQLDIYIPEINLAFEFNGEYWHDRKTYENDLLNKTCTTREAIKDQVCAEKNIRLIHIWENDYKKDRLNILHEIIQEIEKLLIKKKFL